MDPPTTTIVAADDPLPQVPGTPKLRLMCSYGGHIIPTPHEKSLRYIGGETRMVAFDRRSSLPSIISRLSSSLLHGSRNFSLKYQLPNEELDSLVSLSSDEDLENLIDEYDRLVATASSSSAFRLRIFIFFAKPETAASMEALLDDAKSETWFVDALNAVSLLPRGLSDSAAVVDQMLDLDSVSAENNEKQTIAVDAHEVLAGMSDSYIVENNSSPSFGSSTSSLSMSNLPPIRVRVEESVKAGIDETFVSKSDTAAYSDVVQNVDYVGNPVGDNQFKAVSEEERSDRYKVQVGFRKPPLPISLPSQHVQQQHKNGLPYNLPSPDSATSQTSITSASADSKLVLSQDPVQNPVKENRAPTSPLDRPKQIHDSSPTYQMMQLHETTYLMPSQHDHDVYSQQQQLHRVEVQQQHYFNTGTQPESETRGDQMPTSEQSDQHPSSDSQNQRTHHLQETLYISSPQSTEYQQNLHHQQRQFIHPSMQHSYGTSAVKGQMSEQLRPQLQQQQHNQFVSAKIQQQQVYFPPQNQAEQFHEQQVQQSQSQQQFIQGSMQYVHQASAGQAPIPSYYSMYTTHQPHQQFHHQTMYMLPVAQAQAYNNTLSVSQANSISDMTLTRLPIQPNASMLPAPSIQTQTETPSSTILMSPNPTLIQAPSGQNQQQYVSYSQFLHPAQSMPAPVTHGNNYTSRDPQVYYTDQHHPSAVPQYQTMNSFTHGHGAVPSEAASHLPPADQHP